MKLTDSRKKHLRARIKEYSEAEVCAVIEAAKRSRFLMGENDRRWKADFDWLMKPTNFTKVVEGKYDEASCSQSKIQTF